MRFLLIFFWLLSGLAMAQDVTVETNPRNPIKGEPFQIVFKCETTRNVDPEITFDSEGFEVLGKQSQGLSTRTVYSQGQIKTTRELMVVYEAMAPKAGRINLKNLVVILDGKRMTEAVVPIQVLEAPVEPKFAFIAAEVPKRSFYVGEGFLLRYYVYHRINLQSTEVKKFSKLDGFMKRYLQENDRGERVVVDGDVYRKAIIYSARIYPDRPGKLIVDPMEVSVNYGGDPLSALGFGGFGGLHETKTKVLRSEPVEVDVKPLPAEGKPASFSGLVGPHQFDLKVTQQQLLVNEPLEVKLKISGPGNLENMESPVIWDTPELEKFDTKSNLELIRGESAEKTIDYTFLGKAPGVVKAREVEFSYFDPGAGTYVKVMRRLPEIVVAGSATPAVRPPSPTTTPREEAKAPTDGAAEAGEKFIREGAGWLTRPSTWLALLGAILIVVVIWKGKSLRSLYVRERASWESDYEALTKGHLSSATLTRLLHALSPRRDQALPTILAESGLSPEAQRYFTELLMQLERREFATSHPTGDIVLDKSHLQALRKNLKGKNENGKLA